MRTYSSREAAHKLGLLPTTLSNYIVAKKIPVPNSITTGGITVYLWTNEDIERVRKLLPKIANGRKTRYQKKKQEKKKLILSSAPFASSAVKRICCWFGLANCQLPTANCFFPAVLP